MDVKRPSRRANSLCWKTVCEVRKYLVRFDYAPFRNELPVLSFFINPAREVVSAPFSVFASTFFVDACVAGVCVS